MIHKTNRLKQTSKVIIQSTNFNALVTECITNQLLPITSSFHKQEYKKQRQLIEFYGNGYLKERLTLKIITSFELSNPHFLTILRSTILKQKSQIVDQLHLEKYFTGNITVSQNALFLGKIQKETLLTVFIGEIGIQKHNKELSIEQKYWLNEIEQFIINLMFINGCNSIFNSPMKIVVKKNWNKLYCSKRKVKEQYEFDYSLDNLFDL